MLYYWLSIKGVALHFFLARAMIMEVCQKCRREMENICINCAEKFLESLFVIYRRPTLIPILRSRTLRFSCYGTTSKLCNLCGNNIGVCVDCYVNGISEWLKQDYPGLSKIVSNIKNRLKRLATRIELKI